MTSAAKQIVQCLTRNEQKIVLAESCTCGIAASLIGGVPGASACFCGSFVTYREASKTSWLDVDPDTLREHSAESRQTTDALVLGAIKQTPEADWAAAVTGHLGPGIQDDRDGRVFFALFNRTSGNSLHHEIKLAQDQRVARQVECGERLLAWILQHLEGSLNLKTTPNAAR